MKLFFKYFLLFVPTFLASFISNEIRTASTRTESLPYSLIYIKPNYNLIYLIIGFSFPIVFFIHGYLEYNYSLLLFKYAIVFATFLSGLWIISRNEIILEISKAAKIFFWFFFILALIQNTNILNFLDPIFSTIFSKGGLGTGESYRGASLLYSEPSRASFYILFMYILGYGIKVKKNNFLAFLILTIVELLLIRSTTGYFIYLLFLIINFPIRVLLASLFFYLIFIGYQIFEFPDLYNFHYKIDFIFKRVIAGNESLISIVMSIDGERLSGIIFSINTIINNPFGVLFEPSLFEPVSGRIAVSGPLLFIRTFGIFGLIYLLFYIRSTGHGSYIAFLYTILIGCLYSPNASCIVLLAATIEYKREYLNMKK